MTGYDPFSEFFALTQALSEMTAKGLFPQPVQPARGVYFKQNLNRAG